MLEVKYHGVYSFKLLKDTEKIIDRGLGDAADRIPLFFNGVNLDASHHSAKRPWLLACSQTENFEGEKMIDGFNKFVMAGAMDSLELQESFSQGMGNNGLRNILDFVEKK